MEDNLCTILLEAFQTLFLTIKNLKMMSFDSINYSPFCDVFMG